MQRRVIATLCLITGLSFATGTSVHADDGALRMSASRQSITVKAGTSTTTRLKIANKTDFPMDVTLSVKSFRVDPYTRAVTFTEPRENWIQPDTPHVNLAPAAEQSITYHVTIPDTAKEQEYHFALVASTTVDDGSNTKTLRVASLLYLAVDGGHLARASTITTAHIPRFATGTSIPYTFAIKNTGNIHLELQSNVQLQGDSWGSPTTDQRAVVLPGESRTVSDRVPAPFLPGFYVLRYGYTDETTGAKTVQITPVVYVPLWAAGVLIVLILCSIWLWQRRRHRRATTSDQ